MTEADAMVFARSDGSGGDRVAQQADRQGARYIRSLRIDKHRFKTV
jgi:hypothetical protein